MNLLIFSRFTSQIWAAFPHRFSAYPNILVITNSENYTEASSLTYGSNASLYARVSVHCSQVWSWVINMSVEQITMRVSTLFRQTIGIHLVSIYAFLISTSHDILLRPRGSLLGWGTMLQPGRSRDRFPVWSLDFSLYLIIQAAL
jgi:hypothetical protein